MNECVIDMSNKAQREALWKSLRNLSGRVRFAWCNYRARRSDRQNRYYWPCFVVPFAKWLSEQYGHTVSEDQAHEILKDAHLRVLVINSESGVTVFNAAGDPLMRTRSTTELNTVEFNEYLDHCAETLRELAGIEPPHPSIYHERDQKRGAA